MLISFQNFLDSTRAFGIPNRHMCAVYIVFELVAGGALALLIVVIDYLFGRNSPPHDEIISDFRKRRILIIAPGAGHHVRVVFSEWSTGK